MLHLLVAGAVLGQSSVGALGGASDAAQGVFDRISPSARKDTAARELPFTSGSPSEAMEAYIKENLRFPRSEYDAGVQGKVLVQFIVSKEGNVQDVKVIQGITPGMDAEAIRVVKSLPAQVAEGKSGKPLTTQYVVPVRFEL